METARGTLRVTLSEDPNAVSRVQCDLRGKTEVSSGLTSVPRGSGTGTRRARGGHTKSPVPEGTWATYVVNELVNVPKIKES